MPILIMDDQGSISQEHRQINLSVAPEGTVSPSTIPLGNMGDHRYTKLVFDFSHLDWYDSTENEYNFILQFYNPNEEKTSDNPKVFNFNSEEFYVPAELTADPVKYSIILIIQEIITDEVEGNVAGYREVFVSSEFKGNIQATGYIEGLDQAASMVQPLVDDGRSLVKPPLSVILNEDGTLTLSDYNLGNKKDQFIRRVIHATDMGSLNKYMIYHRQNSEYYIQKFDENGVSWIPADITTELLDWDVFCLYLADDGSVRHVSTTQRVNVTDNFLSETSYIPGDIFTIDNKELTDNAGNTLVEAGEE